ncbi:MAG: hypothetical protein J7527_19555, partial [Chitinophagaceae bacterium]|nr:hypothetical protein [Chitinophagaceae bacterium]
MRKCLALLTFSLQLLAVQSFAQTRDQVFANMQKLLKKAEGQKVSGFTGEKKITKQTISSAEITAYEKGTGKYSSEWVNRYTKIPWNDLTDHVIYDESGNDKLKIVKLSFKKLLISEFFTSDKTGADELRKYSSAEVWILRKDAADMEEYINQLYKLKEKKRESPYNATIRSFTKEQTISWLKAKLLEHMEGGQFDRDIRIVSMDECKIKVTYAGLSRKYEAEIPTAIQEVTDKGSFKYATKIASVKSTTVDMLDKGERTYGEYAAIGISSNDEELMDNIGCAMKHLAGFCNGTNRVNNNTNSGNAGKTNSGAVSNTNSGSVNSAVSAQKTTNTSTAKKKKPSEHSGLYLSELYEIFNRTDYYNHISVLAEMGFVYVTKNDNEMKIVFRKENNDDNGGRLSLFYDNKKNKFVRLEYATA